MSPPVDGGSCVPPCLTPKSFCGKVRQAQGKMSTLPWMRNTQVDDGSLCCPLQDGACACELGFTEVFLHTGQLNRCVPIPVLDIPPWEDKKGDVKTIRAIDTPPPTPVLPGLPGRTWYLQPYGPGQTGSSRCRPGNASDRRPSLSTDGKLKIWVYGVAIGAFVLLVFIASMTYLAW